jgi:hypothetical protein
MNQSPLARQVELPKSIQLFRHAQIPLDRPIFETLCRWEPAQ